MGRFQLPIGHEALRIMLYEALLNRALVLYATLTQCSEAAALLSSWTSARQRLRAVARELWIAKSLHLIGIYGKGFEADSVVPGCYGGDARKLCSSFIRTEARWSYKGSWSGNLAVRNGTWSTCATMWLSAIDLVATPRAGDKLPANLPPLSSAPNIPIYPLGPRIFPSYIPPGGCRHQRSCRWRVRQPLQSHQCHSPVLESRILSVFSLKFYIDVACRIGCWNSPLGERGRLSNGDQGHRAKDEHARQR
jgi:hypothetical protein